MTPLSHLDKTARKLFDLEGKLRKAMASRKRQYTIWYRCTGCNDILTDREIITQHPRCSRAYVSDPPETQTLCPYCAGECELVDEPLVAKVQADLGVGNEDGEA
jgi:hypothetical protein